MVRKSTFRRIIPIAVLFMWCFSLSLITHPLTIGHSSLAYTQDVVNSNIYYLPHLNLGQGWQTTINITNTECKGKHRRVNVTLTAYDKEGVSLGVVAGIKRLKPNKTKKINIQTLPSATESLKIESNGNLICNAIFKATDSKKSEVVPAVKEPSKQLDFPSLVSYDDLYIYKTITLLNTNTTPASVDIIALDKDGYEIGRNALPSISLMESKTFPLVDIFGPRILKDLSTVRINSDSNIIGLQLVDYPGVDLVGLPALTTTSKGWTFPIATKGENFNLWTKMGILNPGNDIAKVTIVAFDAGNNSLGIIHSETILPGVIYVVNTANIDAIEGDAIPLNTAILKVTSTQPVIGYEVIGILDGNGLAAAMGIPDEDKTVGGFEITGSTDGGMLNTHSMMRMGDGSVKSTAGSLGIEEWRENVNIIPDTSEIISAPTTELNENAGVYQNTGISLVFPLKYNDWTPYTAEITSVFDHSMKDRYKCDEVVEAYTAEIGRKKFGDNAKQQCIVPGYKNDGTNNGEFYVNNHYVGATGGKQYLNYDGHPAYDYKVGIGKTVYAAADGTVAEAGWDDDGGGGYYIRIQHDKDYTTSYLHLTENSNKKFNVYEGLPVKAEQPIAESGNTRTSTGGTVSAHLHFEVRKGWVKNIYKGTSIDPYGWHPPVPTVDPYKTLTDIDNTTLWAAKDTLPQITTISPTNGVADTPVMIDGSRMQGANTVKFGTVTAKFTWSGTKIIATAPDGNGVVHVRVTTAAGTSDEEIPFTYTSSPTIVTVISPNGGENLQAGSTQTITWKVEGDTSKINNFLVGYSIDGVPNLKKTKTVTSSARSLTLPIPSFVSSTQCKVGVRARDVVGNILAEDVSDSNFTISTCQAPGSFTLTATPECNGSSPQIRLNWTASSGSTVYDVYRNGNLYYSNAVETQYMDSSNIASGMTYTYSVKAKNSCGSTNSNTASAIAINCNTTVTVISPNGGESWQNGTTQTIRWVYTGNPGSYVKIELLKGGSISTITSGASIGSNGSGSYNWTIPLTQTTGSDYKVRITSATNSTFTDTSDNNFTIGGTSLTVTYFRVNSDASSTTSRIVTLNNTAIGSPTHYMASESSTFSGASWQTYSTAPSFTLSSGNGTKTVYFKVKNSANVESSVVSDSITLSESTSCIATVSSDRWKGEYYNNKGLSGSPSLVRDDGNGFIDFDWDSGSPGSFCGIGEDDFSVRWTRIVSFNTGTYRFTVTSDDGFRLYVDNSLKLDKWIDQGSTTYTVDVPLSAGNHTIKMEYYEAGGGAVAKLSWEVVSSTNPPPPITDLKATAECDGTRSQIRLNWTASSGATSYDVYRNYSLYSSDVTGTQFINYGNITVGETYTYSVRAKNAYGSSADSNVVSTTAKDCNQYLPPPPITDLKATAECDGTRSQIRLNWTASSGATSYDVYRNYSLYSSDVTGTQFINYGNITVGETYTYSVRAKNAYGSSADSNVVSTTAKDCRGSTTQVERVTNGSFSSGTSGWTLSGDFWAGTNLFNYRTSPGYAAGGVDSSGTPKNDAYGSMYQSVTIPSNATSATISFWYNITSNESGYGQYDLLYVIIQNSSGSYLAPVATLSNADKGSLGVYSKKTLDVTSYKGQTIRIYFLATTDNINTTTFRIDDVSLMSDGN